MTVTERHLEAFVDFLALAYHEARNVRHLIHDCRVPTEPYARLVSLPTNKVEAWKQLQSLRLAAKKAGSASRVETLFRDQFQVSLDDLLVLFENQGWKDSARGGNQWAAITRELAQLRDAIQSSEQQRSEQLIARIEAMRHNTGIVGDKLSSLDREIASGLEPSRPQPSAP